MECDPLNASCRDEILRYEVEY